MQKVPRSYELVLVDDASLDGTWEKICEAQQRNSRVRALHHQHNGGQSAALWTGIRATSSPILVTLDGDRQNDPVDLPRLLDGLRDCDFVCGVRCERHDSWLRRLSTRAARAARRRVLKVDFCDTGCAFRAFRREALDGIFPFDGMHRFLPVLVHANGARTKEISISHRPRICGESKYGLWNRLGRGIYDLVALSWLQKRRLTSIETMEPQWIRPRSTRSQTPGWTDVKLRTRDPEFHPVEAR